MNDNKISPNKKTEVSPMATNHREIPKPLGERIADLALSLQIIRDANEAIQRGNFYQVIVLSGQLRALLTDDGKHSGPLLLETAKELKEELRVFAMMPDSDSSILGQAFMNHMNPMVSFNRQFAKQVEVPFEDILDKQYFRYNGSSFSFRKIIEKYANRAGGAHYSKNLPAYFLEQKKFNIGGLNPMQQSIWTLGKAVQKVGHQLLKKLFGFRLVIQFVLHEMPQEAFCLVNAKHSNGNMGYDVFITSAGELLFDFLGLENQQLLFRSLPCLTADSGNVLEIEIEVLDSLETRIVAYINGIGIEDSRYCNLLLIQSDTTDFKILIGYHGMLECNSIPFSIREQIKYDAAFSETQNDFIIGESEDIDRAGQEVFTKIDIGTYLTKEPGEQMLHLHRSVSI